MTNPLILLEGLLFSAMFTACSSMPHSAQSDGKTILEKETHFPKEEFPTIILDGIWGLHSRWEPLRRSIEAQIGPCQIWRYKNSGQQSLEMAGTELAAEMARLNRPCNVIGYSMGGLVIREAIRQRPDLPVRCAIFLHTPHAGSKLARFIPLPACREMRPQSIFLSRLENAPWSIPTLVTWCPWDASVVPGSSARWEKAERIIRSDVPLHLWPVFSPQIHREVLCYLKTGGK